MKIEALVTVSAPNIRAFKRRFPEANVWSINGRAVVGVCENCGGPIYQETKHDADSDGVMWHKRCPKVSK